MWTFWDQVITYCILYFCFLSKKKQITDNENLLHLAKLSPALRFNPFKNTGTGYKMTLISLLLWSVCGVIDVKTKPFFLSSPVSFANAAAFSQTAFMAKTFPSSSLDVFFSFQRRPLGSERLDAATIGFAVTENSHFIESLPMADARETSASLLSFFFFFLFSMNGRLNLLQHTNAQKSAQSSLVCFLFLFERPVCR